MAYPVNMALNATIWCSLIFFTFDINKVKVKLSLRQFADFMALKQTLMYYMKVEVFMIGYTYLHCAWKIAYMSMKLND